MGEQHTDANMNTVAVWNVAVGDFMQQLEVALPSETVAIGDARDAFMALKAFDESAPMKRFMDEAMPHMRAIVSRDDRLITDEGIPLLRKINLKLHWTDGSMPDVNKTAIWTTLNLLLAHGQGIMAVPPDLLSMSMQIGRQLEAANPNLSKEFGSADNVQAEDIMMIAGQLAKSLPDIMRQMAGAGGSGNPFQK